MFKTGIQASRHGGGSGAGAGRLAKLLTFSALFLLMVFLGGALAETGGGEEAASPATPKPPSSQELQAFSGGADVTTDPQAAESLPHADLTRAEAIELMTSVFPSALEAPAGIYRGLEVEEFHSDHVAVVAPETAGEPGLLSSLLPLRVQNEEGVKQAVDLELGHEEGELQPTNPLVDVEIPDTLEDSIALPGSDVQISLDGAARSASTVEGAAAFYPNVAQDSDLAVVPTPTGVETLTQLRSADAPTTQTFELSLPAGATLEATDDGGAIAEDQDGPLLLVHPPTAVDAAGEAVPVSLQVQGSAITLQVDPPQDVAYPILVDPLYENYYWMAWGKGVESGLFNDWKESTTNSNFFKTTDRLSINGTQYNGLTVRSSEGGPTTPGDRASWFYYVPRYFFDQQYDGGKVPTSYIQAMSFSYVYYLIGENAPVHAHPYAIVGLWDESKQGWVSAASRSGGEGNWNAATIEASNPSSVTNVKSGGIMLATSESASYPRSLFAGQGGVVVSDPDLPAFAFDPTPANWYNAAVGTKEPVKFTLSDFGLGAQSIQAKMPSARGGSLSLEQAFGCTGAASSACPRTWSGLVNFDPSQMSQGEDVIEITGKDPIGHTPAAPKLVKVKIDHTAPDLALSGNLTQQGTVGANLSEYTLNYSATDGDDAAAVAGTPLALPAGAKGVSTKDPRGVDVDVNGNIWVVDRQFRRVIKLDPAGNALSEFTITGAVEPTGIAVNPAGNLWVADPGAKRVQLFKPGGEVIRSIAYAGFNAPYAVATGPSETLWVSDIGAKNIFRFREDGTYQGQVSANSINSVAINADAYGNLWAAEQTTNKILEFSSTGAYLFSFGSGGSADGQLSAPNGLAIAPSGNLFVSDTLNNRLQVFKPDGSFLRKFGTAGTAAANLSSPRGLAVGPGNVAYIGDTGNSRIARWTHADRDPQSGMKTLQVLVDGVLAKKEGEDPGCATKNCAIAGSWTLDADDYTPGPHKVEVVAADTVGLVTRQTLNIETHGDQTAPSIALSGSMTEQATLGTTLPSYLLKVGATDAGSPEERKSGVVSTSIRVDGVTKDSVSPGCPAGGCSINREWTLNSSSFAAGDRKVEVSATDGAGHTTTKLLTLKIDRDTTAPEIQASSNFYTAPEGWVEQKTYNYNATATDAGGYGTTALTLKIDGAVVKSITQACSAGGCSQSFGTVSVDMSQYQGGSHPAELIATDGAGNIRKRNWTINVDPYGEVTMGEATDTLEAVELTAPEVTDLTPVDALVSQGESQPGEQADPTLSLAGSSIETKGASVPSTISLDPAHGFTLKSSGFSESGTPQDANISVVPTGLNSTASTPAIVGGSAAVSINTYSQVDSVIRPSYDGIMAFKAIRDKSGPERYEWEIKGLAQDEELKLIDSQHAGVFWSDGTEALLISAQLAHGADGKAVPTSLAVSGNVITETVHHREGAYVYPVVAGLGWDGGWVETPANVSEPAKEPEYLGPGVVESISFGAPEIYPSEPSDTEGASVSGTIFKARREFAAHQCEPSVFGEGVGCGIWEMKMKGFFWYNLRQAWWSREPRCPSHDLYLVTEVQVPELCDWVGPNHQRYGAGYHITAQVFYRVTHLKINLTDRHHLTVRAFGSGHAYPHDTECICNPSVPGQEE